MGEYNKVDEAVIQRLKDIVGEKNILVQKGDRADYAFDETPDLRFLPEVVVKPASTREVSGIMYLASEYRIPVTPRGAGTGLTGGALPVYGGIMTPQAS